MLRYYIKDIPNVDLLKPKVMKLAYIGKVAFNTNGMPIHSTLAIPCKKFHEFKAFSDEKCNGLIKNCDKLHLLIVDEISLFGNKILSFIDCRL